MSRCFSSDPAAKSKAGRSRGRRYGYKCVTLTLDDAASSSLSGAISAALICRRWCLPPYFQFTRSGSSLRHHPRPFGGDTERHLVAYVQILRRGYGQHCERLEFAIRNHHFHDQLLRHHPAPTLTSTTYPRHRAIQLERDLGAKLSSAIPDQSDRRRLLNLGAPIAGSNTILGITDNVGDAPFRFYRLLIMP